MSASAERRRAALLQCRPTSPAAPGSPTGPALFALISDRRGAVAAATALLVPVLLGFVGLGTEVGIWMYARQSLQSAADGAALSAAVNVAAGSTSKTVDEATAALAKYGYVGGTGGVTVAVNQPPTTGNFSTNNKAVEVIVGQPQPRLFTAMFLGSDVVARARAVAMAGVAGNACVLALDSIVPGAVTVVGNPTVNLTGCSVAVNSSSGSALTLGGSAQMVADSVNVVGGVSGSSKLTTTNGVTTGGAPTADPYAGTPVPTVEPCTKTSYSAPSGALAAGTYCNGLTVNSGSNVTLSGTYIISGGTLSINGGATVSGTGVTFVLTNNASVSINGNATVSLSAPTTGSLAGLVMFVDPASTSTPTFKINGGAGFNVTGAIYAPTVAVTFSGGAATGGSTCTQLVAKTISFGGSANFQQNCATAGTKSIGAVPSVLVE
jgi:Flp pilus assembly protein TadG